MDPLVFSQVLFQPRGDEEFSWPLALFLVGFFAAIAGTVSLIIWQVFATSRARMSIAREEAFRNLTNDLATYQSRLADTLERSASELSEIRQRIGEVERLLREVG